MDECGDDGLALYSHLGFKGRASVVKEAMQKVCIIIPTYNESETIGLSLDALEREFAKIHDFDMTILVFDSHSADSDIKRGAEYVGSLRWGGRLDRHAAVFFCGGA